MPDDPLLLPDEAGISPGGWDFIGTSGEVGDTCELFSLPGPTAPGVTLAAPFAPRSGFSGVASPGADCAGATKSAAAVIAARNVFMGIPPFGSLESNAPAIRHVPNRTKRKTRSSSYEEARATPQIAQAFRSCGPSTQLCRPPLIPGAFFHDLMAQLDDAGFCSDVAALGISSLAFGWVELRGSVGARDC